MNIEHNTKTILIIDNYVEDELIVFNLDLNIKKTHCYGLWGIDNEEVIDMIKSVLNDDYNIEYEIEEYKKSEMYKLLKEEEEEE